jgi:hypothetical protein
MIDIRGWLWFGIRLSIYSTILFLIFIGLIFIFVIWYYWFVVRRRSRIEHEINTKLPNRSLTFHTLLFQLSNNGIIVVNVQISALEKQPIEIAQLNGRRYQISSLEINDEQVDIGFAKSNICLTIKHYYIEQQRLEMKKFLVFYKMKKLIFIHIFKLSIKTNVFCT